MLCFAYEGKDIWEILHMQFYVSEYSLTYMQFKTYEHLCICISVHMKF